MEANGMSAARMRDRRRLQLEQQIDRYDAQRQSQRRPLNFRNGQSLLRGLMQGARADPPSIAAAKAELKAMQRGAGAGIDEQGNQGYRDFDAQLATAIDRLTQEASASGSFQSLADSDRLVRNRVADCVAWRSASGITLPQSLTALDRFERTNRAALGAAATSMAPRIRSEIAAAPDSSTLQRIRAEYLNTPGANEALGASGVTQAFSVRLATVQRNELASANAAQARRDAASAQAARIAAAQQAKAEAAERALLARQRTAQGPSAVASININSAGEPTETQMRAALQENAGRIASRFGLGDWTKITYFEKVGCEKAQGRIGWQCDFLTRSDGNPMTGFLDAMTGPGMAIRGSARFVLRSNGWDAFVDQKNN
ncbi:hypothetical protein [Sphingomonas sp. SAFR-052]|uniref:hypothetical protein n=1 Tax=Sphingomonas sp. SAFR-052 TaxID=3436867 RepID=UPI003F81ADC0